VHSTSTFPAMSAPWQQAGAGATALPVDGVSENPSSANGAAVPNTAARSRAIMRRALSPAVRTASPVNLKPVTKAFLVHHTLH
jgi:hypothetical protein